ncbi:MAG TPA: glycine cleavage system protein GcvH [Candidatus Acidoferrales bacterium]|jgi:glycine cleavage system H protein|nr:glycine cleavage system protein GcvH [Candidatus Acidoferrales bacterium]
MYPAGYRYTKEHEWIQVDASTATIGITDYAQQELGDIVSVELPKTGAQIKAGQFLGTVESVKAVSDLMSPVSGEVTETNAKLKDAPETINKDPHTAGWIAKVRLADAKELDGLLDAAAYEKFVEEKAKEAAG